MSRVCRICCATRTSCVRELPGSGAAGGLGAAFLALGATLRPGVEVVAEAAGLDDAVRGADLVLTGEGRGFCSGGSVHDIIGPLLEMPAHELLAFTRLTGELIGNLRALPKPVVAAVNGIAAGAGAVIALACDLRVMAENAKIAFLFVRVGLAGADMGAAWLLPQVVGLGRASEILMLGDAVTAPRALEMGLCNRVVADAAAARTEAQALAPPRQAARTIALLTVIFGLGQVAGPLLAASLAGPDGNFRISLLVAGIVVLVAAFIALASALGPRRKDEDA